MATIESAWLNNDESPVVQSSILDELLWVNKCTTCENVYATMTAWSPTRKTNAVYCSVLSIAAVPEQL